MTEKSDLRNDVQSPFGDVFPTWWEVIAVLVFVLVVFPIMTALRWLREVQES